MAYRDERHGIGITAEADRDALSVKNRTVRSSGLDVDAAEVRLVANPYLRASISLANHGDAAPQAGDGLVSDAVDAPDSLHAVDETTNVQVLLIRGHLYVLCSVRKTCVTQREERTVALAVASETVDGLGRSM